MRVSRATLELLGDGDSHMSLLEVCARPENGNEVHVFAFEDYERGGLRVAWQVRNRLSCAWKWIEEEPVRLSERG